MGFTPAEVGAMSVWKYLAAVDGYAAANSPEDVGLSDGEKNELAEWLGI